MPLAKSFVLTAMMIASHHRNGRNPIDSPRHAARGLAAMGRAPGRDEESFFPFEAGMLLIIKGGKMR